MVSAFYLSDVLEDVEDEAQRARDKFGSQTDLSDLEWLAILGEEFGEAAMEVTKNYVRPLIPGRGFEERLRAEVIQVAAVAARWVRAIDARLDSR